MATIVSAVVMVIVMPHVASLDSIIRQRIAKNPCLTMTLSFDEKKGTAQYNNTHFENETTPKKWMAPD